METPTSKTPNPSGQRLHEGQSAFLAEQLGQRVAILPVILFLVVGLILLFFVDEARARQDRDGSVT
jgi:hypothetical protein